ncbi:hypothetical protein JST97_17400 [bacterium]|nr:hypothetical protein [bacterium]
MRSFSLQCRSMPEFLQPVPAIQAFDRLARLLVVLKQNALPPPEESRFLKEQLLAQAAVLESSPDTVHLTRQAQAAGLLCGALDGGRLYLEEKPVLDFVAPSRLWLEEIQELTAVADQYWRGLDIASLHQQSVYARQENLKTESENLEVLTGADSQQIRRQFSETFRIAYGVGLLDSALAFLFLKQ